MPRTTSPISYEDRLTLVEHLDELRRRIIICLAGLFIAFFFHLFNSIVFQIGIFPYLMLAALAFFFEPEKIRRLFFKRKPALTTNLVKSGGWEFRALNQLPFKLILGGYLLVQLWLPLRHLVFEGDVHWTEEGHRMAWRMMLRSKSGTLHYEVKIPEAGISEKIYPSALLRFE